MTSYFLKEDSILAGLLNVDQIDIQGLGEAMERASQRPGGLTARGFQEDAQDPLHPAHKHLQWSDRECGTLYRDDQCRQLFRAVMVIEPISDKETRAFVSIRSDRGASYRYVENVLSSSDLTDRLLAQAEADLRTFEVRYRSLVEIVELVQQARTKIAARRQPRRGSGRPSANLSTP